MNVAMMQPAFMPWQGFFELIYRAERFVFLDDFQFSVQSYHQRNRLFVNKGQVDWYSVSVMKSVSFGAPLNETKLNETIPWRQKMWKRLQQNYAKAPFYAAIAPAVGNRSRLLPRPRWQSRISPLLNLSVICWVFAGSSGLVRLCHRRSGAPIGSWSCCGAGAMRPTIIAPAVLSLTCKRMVSFPSAILA